MTIEERRQCLYASLLRFTPEAKSLRDRALDKLILVSLVGSSEHEPFRVGRIRDNIMASSGSVGVRPKTIQESLKRLIAKGKVSETELRKRRAYFLAELGYSDIATSETTASQLFEPVLSYLTEDLDPSLPDEDARDIFIKFISIMFSVFGHKIAQVVTSTLSIVEFADSVNMNQLVGRAIGERSLSPHVMDSIKARCKRFIRSEDPASVKLKFRLTQGFYIAQLLGVDSAGFNPLARESFKGSIMFLDTNTVISRIMDLEEASMFDEVVSISKGLGIDLRISRATIDELEDVLPKQLDDLKKVIETVPHELIEQAEGDFVDSYIGWLTDNPDGGFDAFVAQIETVDSIIENSDITLDNRSAGDIIAGRDVEKV